MALIDMTLPHTRVCHLPVSRECAELAPPHGRLREFSNAAYGATVDWLLLAGRLPGAFFLPRHGAFQ